MYKTSTDKRFQKNKRDIQRAYIDLTMEKGFGKVTISDIAKRADINRMTFYAHYEAVEDIFTEFVDDMETYLTLKIQENPDMTLDEFLRLNEELMEKEIEFFRFCAKEDSCSAFRVAFRNTYQKLITISFDEKATYSEEEKLIEADLISVCIAYAWLDWLAGNYGDVSIDVVIKYLEKMLLNDNISLKLK